MKLAKNRETGEKFAVKVFSKSKMSEEDVKLAIMEIEILQSLDHPNIVRMIEAFESERHLTLVMEQMCGGDLFTKIIEDFKFTEADVRQIII